MTKSDIIKRLVDRIILPEHDDTIRRGIERDLQRLSYRTLAWMENRIEIKEIKDRRTKCVQKGSTSGN
mgnify:CR=1 FL=1